MDRLTALRIFMAVADKRSFAEAARGLRISPTAASRGIAALEDELGAMLLRRTTRSVGLTPEGEAYLARCRHILADLEDADRVVRGVNAEPHGTLLLAAPVVFGRMHIMPIVSTLLSTYADLTVQLALNDRVVRLVEEGIDVAVRIADLSDSALHAVRIAQVRRVLVASPDYLARRGIPSEVAHLHDHDLILFENLAQNREWRFTETGRTAIRVEPRLAMNDIEAAIEAARAGLGIARALSYQVAEHVRAGRLRYLLEDQEPASLPINLVFQGSRRRTPNVRVFIDAARDYCAARCFA